MMGVREGILPLEVTSLATKITDQDITVIHEALLDDRPITEIQVKADNRSSESIQDTLIQV